MLDEGEWPKEMEYILCEDFNEDKIPRRSGLDLKKALQNVGHIWSYKNKNLLK